MTAKGLKMCFDGSGNCLGMRGSITQERTDREISVVENGLPFSKARVLMGFMAQRERMVLDIPSIL